MSKPELSCCILSSCEKGCNQKRIEMVQFFNFILIIILWNYLEYLELQSLGNLVLDSL